MIQSFYGSFGGISTASLGLSYFIFHLSLLIGLNRFRADAPAIVISTVFILSIIGVAFSLYFIYLLKVVLQQSCFACYGVHFINAILFAQYLILLIRHRRFFAKQRLIGFLLEPKSITIAVFSLLMALGGCFMSNLLAAIQSREAAVSDVNLAIGGTLETAPPHFSAVEMKVSAAHEDRELMEKLVTIGIIRQE